MSNREVSSLDRFVTTRGPVLAGLADDSGRLRTMTILSTFYAVVGASFFAGAAAFDGGALAMAATGGLFLATSGLLGGIRLWLKSRLQPEETTRAELTPDANELLRALIHHLQGRTFGRRRRRRLRRAMQRGMTDPERTQRCEAILTPEAFDLLESAAFEYNRILGVIDGSGQPGGAGFARFIPEILAASDATMAELLDTAALLNRLPETAPRLEAEARSRVRELTELGGEVERLRGASLSSPVPAEDATPVRRLLEELRADQRAREELHRSWSEPEEQRIELRAGAGE